MKTSIKTGFAQIFFCYPKKMGVCENLRLRGGGGGTAACTPPLTKLKRISSSSSNYVVLTF